MLGHAPLSTNSVSELAQASAATLAVTLDGVAVSVSASVASPGTLAVTLDGVAVSVSGAVNANHTGTLGATLEGVTVALAGTAAAPQPIGPGVTIQQSPAGGMGWAWVGDKMVYGTREDVERAAKAHQEEPPKADEPKPKPKRKKRRKSFEAEVSQPLTLVIPMIDWLGGEPDMAAFQAQAEVEALIARMRQMEQDDEERLLAIVQEQERQQVIAALELLERVL